MKKIALILSVFALALGGDVLAQQHYEDHTEGAQYPFLKVKGALTAGSVNAAAQNPGTLNVASDAGIGGNLAVGGNETVAGTDSPTFLNVASDAGVGGNLGVAGNLGVTGDAGVTGNLGVTGTLYSATESCSGTDTATHFAGGGAMPPTPIADAGCGTSSAPAIAAGSTDSSGKVTVTCGATGAVSTLALLQQFATPYASAPKCDIWPANAATAAIPAAQAVYPQTTTGSLQVLTNATGLASGTYSWGYKCEQ